MHGRRYGLAGKNGAGKSTLLRLIAARRLAGLPASLRILYVAQDSADRIAAAGISVIDAVLRSDETRERLLGERARLEERGVGAPVVGPGQGAEAAQPAATGAAAAAAAAEAAAAAAERLAQVRVFTHWALGRGWGGGVAPIWPPSGCSCVSTAGCPGGGRPSFVL